MANSRDRGVQCENMVADHLLRHGHRIVCRNYRCPYGELDIVSVHDGVLCVTEVKSLSPGWDASEIRYMVSPAKMAKMKKTLSHLLASNEIEHFNRIRFDVAAVTGSKVEIYRGDE